MERNTYIDNIKGYLIVLVVLGHIMELMLNNFDVARHSFMFIYIFHMPLFTFLSGYFSMTEKEGYIGKKLLTRILLPYIIFQTLLLIIKFTYHQPGTITEFIEAIITPQWALWYIFCLFFWRLVLPYFMKLPNPVVLSIAIGLLGGFLPKYGLLLSSSRMMAFFPFFVAGYYTKEKGLFPRQLENLKNSKYKIASIIILLCALIFSVIFSGKFISHFVYIKSYFDTGNSVWLCLIFRLIAYSAAFLAGLSFMIIVPKAASVISLLGERSLYIYLLHCPIFYVFVCSQSLNIIKHLYGFVAITLSGILLAIVLSTNVVQRITRPLVEPHKAWNL
ncbi:MAG: acyltransferase family protein [Smithella sp.]